MIHVSMHENPCPQSIAKDGTMWEDTCLVVDDVLEARHSPVVNGSVAAYRLHTVDISIAAARRG